MPVLYEIRDPPQHQLDTGRSRRLRGGTNEWDDIPEELDEPCILLCLRLPGGHTEDGPASI